MYTRSGFILTLRSAKRVHHRSHLKKNAHNSRQATSTAVRGARSCHTLTEIRTCVARHRGAGHDNQNVNFVQSTVQRAGKTSGGACLPKTGEPLDRKKRTCVAGCATCRHDSTCRKRTRLVAKLGKPSAHSTAHKPWLVLR